MNDRFRFRAWNKEKKIMLYEAEKGAEGLPFSFISKSKEFVCEQCTGLKDKNGRLIYEGDIVKAEVEEPELKAAGIIIFGRYVHDLGFYLKWIGAPAEPRKYYPGWRADLFYWLEDEGLEIIGNIHENADLLEEKSEKQIL